MILILVAYEKINPPYEGLIEIKFSFGTEAEVEKINTGQSNLPGYRVLTHQTADEDTNVARFVRKTMQNSSEQKGLEDLMREAFLMGTCRDVYHQKALTAEHKM